MKKILAIILSVAMLCTVVPFSALVSADGDNLIVNGDFETGDNTGWEVSSECSVLEDAAKDGSYGAYVTGGEYAAFCQTVTVKPNTDYVLTYDQYALADNYTILYIKWGGSSGEQRGEWPTTTVDEWVTLSYEFNSGDFDKMFFQFCTGAAEHLLDNITLVEKAAEPEEPEEPADGNLIANGDFETGDIASWSADDWCAANVAVTDAVKYEGNYAVSLTGGYTNVKQTVALEPNTDYVLSAYYQGKPIVYLKAVGNNGAWPDAANEFTLYTYEFNSGDVTSVEVEISCADGTTYFDNITLVKKAAEPEEPEEPEDGNLIANGDFETGKADGWNLVGDATISTDAAKDGKYGAYVTTWGQQINQTFDVEPNSLYEISYWYKGYSVCYVKDASGNGVDTKWTADVEDWTKIAFTVDSKELTKLYVELSGAEKEGWYDNVVVRKLNPTSDGYILNGTFEASTAGWNTHCGDVFVTDADSYSGDYAMQLGCKDEWAGTLTQDGIVLEKNTDYLLTFYAKGLSGELTDKEADFKIELRDGAEGAKIGGEGIGFSLTDDWTEYTYRFNSGDITNAAFMKLFSFGTGNVLLLDDISIQVAPGSINNPIQVSNPMMVPQFVDVPANSTVYYQYNAMFFKDYTITASGVSAITVDGVESTETNMFGAIVAKIKVTSLASGLVGYVNNTDEDVSAYVTHEPPTGTIDNPLWINEGVNSIDTEGAMEYYALFNPDFNGDLTINATVGEDYVIFIENNGEQIEATIVDGKISETITVENGSAVLVVVISMSANTELDIELVGPAAGSEARPIYVFGPEDLAEIDVSNGTVYYQLPADYDGYKMIVTGDEKAFVMMNGTRYDYDAEAGGVVVTLAADNWQLVVGFGSDADDAATVSAEIEFPVGHEYNPIVLENGDVAIKIPEGTFVLYGIYTAPVDGVLTLTPAAAQFADITLANGDNYAWLYTDALQTSVSIEVKAGDVVMVTFAPGYDEDGNVISVDTTVNVDGPVAPLNGWVLEDGKWAFYVDDVKVVNKWMKDSKGWCYLGSDGYWVTNAWVKDSVTWCYIGSDGYCVTNKWVKDSKGWCYLGADGRMVTKAWVRDSVGWCYVGADGYCVTNKWVKDRTGWCYIGSEGRMLTNAWVKDSVGWCYVGADGYCLVDTTVTIDGVEYTFDKDGRWV